MNLIQLYNDYQLNLEFPIECQKNELDTLGEIFSFDGYDEFIKKFDVSNYNLLSSLNFYQDKGKEEPEFFVRSSGTTSSSKYIPVTSAYLDENHFKSARYCLYSMIFNFRQIHLLSGSNLTMTGYKYPDLHLGKEVYDISALIFDKKPLVYKNIGYPKKIFYNWESKLEYLVEHFNKISSSQSISGVPTWMFSLFHKLEEVYGKPTRELFPKLKLIVHGGVNFQNYYNRFNECFPDRELEFFETYNATEGFYGFQVSREEKHLLLGANTGIFYEFRNNKGTFPIWDVEIGEKYELLISNRDGVLRYSTGDIIEVHATYPFLFTIAGRTTEFTNAFGEDLILAQANKAIAKVCEEFSLNVHDFFVVPFYSNEKELGYHEWYFFADRPLEDKKQVADRLDQLVCELNNNYNQKRNGSLAMQRLRIIERNHEDLIRMFQSQGKEIGGQSKLRKLHNDRKILEYLDASLV
ncbi:MAG: GH3 auxin-responsive promoter family protein [Bacteroidota bacterium]